MSLAKFSSLLFVLSALIGWSQAYWRMGCGNIQTGRIDPIVNPGKLSGHSHKIVGPSSMSHPPSHFDKSLPKFARLFSSLCGIISGFFVHLQLEETNTNCTISLDIGLSSTYDDITKAQCTSCTVQADKSAYWAPNLYYAHSDGTFEEVNNTSVILVNCSADKVQRCLLTAW